MNNFSPVKCAESIEPLIFPIPGNFLGEISLIGRFPWFASGEIGGLWGKALRSFTSLEFRAPEARFYYGRVVSYADFRDVITL